MSRYFSPAEFERCTPSCSIKQMDREFLLTLDAVRDAAGIPLVLTSAYRSKEYELAKGRTGNSAHTRGLAVDIRCSSSRTRYKIVCAALGCGIRRIGIGPSFVHLDDDPTLAQGVIWDYYAD